MFQTAQVLVRIVHLAVVVETRPLTRHSEDYSRWVKEKLYMILVYVNDVQIASEDEDYILETKKEICAEYNMTDMKKLDKFLNTKITRARENNNISHTHYCLEVLNIFDFLVQGRTAKSLPPIDEIEKITVRGSKLISIPTDYWCPSLCGYVHKS
jgi:hypothetical protein